MANSKYNPVPVKNVLISVSDKRGLVDLCRGLHRWDVRFFATQGSAQFLRQSAFDVTDIESITQFPEMMEGRVKTLHPKIFGGILARRDEARDVEEASKNGIPLFDLVIVNLYPFEEHLGKEKAAQSSFIDIGGPSLLRAAAKSSAWVTVLTDSSDYEALLKELETHHGATTPEFRHKLAAKVFQRTSAYDALIASEWGEKLEFPSQVSLGIETPLRYGENPHQKAVWCGVKSWRVLQGKELSYNNLLDAESAVRLATEFQNPVIVIVKHNNPCGVAEGGKSLNDTFERALHADSKSAFGGVVATNEEIDRVTAKAMSSIFLEVIAARKFAPAAAEIFSKKQNLRLIEWEKPFFSPFEIRPALGGWLLQDMDSLAIPATLKTVTKRQCSPEELSDLKFAWKVVKHVRSNAIVIAKADTTVGIGAGQMSRVDAVMLALQKRSPSLLQGAALASDAFFPFRDNIDVLKGSGIKAIIQPGGSQRDAEVIEACNELEIAMVFTGQRHFKH